MYVRRRLSPPAYAPCIGTLCQALFDFRCPNPVSCSRSCTWCPEGRRSCPTSSHGKYHKPFEVSPLAANSRRTRSKPLPSFPADPSHVAFFLVDSHRCVFPPMLCFYCCRPRDTIPSFQQDVVV